MTKTIEAYRLLSHRVDYPLHIGITEAGTTFSGTINRRSVSASCCPKASVTPCVSPSPVIRSMRYGSGYGILNALGLRQRGINLVSCPTCGRCQIDLVPLAEEVERRLQGVTKPLTVAIMGCVVNGPGEAREADVGIAGGKGEGLLFRHGEVIRKVPENELADALVTEVEQMANES